MPVFLPRVIPRVQCPYPRDLDHEHGRAEHMARVVAVKTDPVDLHLLVDANHLDLLQATVQVSVVKEHVVGHDQGVGNDHFQDDLRGVRHEDQPFERRFLGKIRKASRLGNLAYHVRHRVSKGNH